MAVGKEIRTKIKSVQSTQKITRAMQMVATSKMRKTQDRMAKARPYANKIREVMRSLADSNVRHPMLKKIEKLESVGIILVTTDKGLCGGLNTNALRLFYQTVQKLETEGIKTKICCIGQKGLIAAQRVQMDIIGSATHLGESPRIDDLIGVASTMIQEYAQGEIDQLLVVYSSFINTMKQQACIEQLLPIEIPPETDSEKKYPWSHMYEPEPDKVLDILIKRYTESVIYQVVVENSACEQAARMIAMKSATDNAENVIHHLQLTYNKARQAAITTELNEIVAGAAAV